uniref:NADH-ubiquinone oxidoreductase chain 4L n=1 Tax=Ceraesignum maximum TaxID=1522080 RepID=E2FLS7_9CAEN|nr:NADH dehydrogenase subunit 4L [Ceraesignum maximum]ADI79393.1 NADH dehydrogenase subunit 4L [Ceraesignum maximum]
MGVSYLGLFAFCCLLFSLISLALQNKHLLGVLLSMEAALMSLFLFLFSVTTAWAGGFSALVLITLAACEASLGLSVLVSMIRVCGNDYVVSLSSQKC